MNVESISRRIPWFAVGIVGLGYALLGWYLAAHDIIWVVGAGATLVTLLVTWRGLPFVKQLLWFSSQSLFLVIAVSFVVSLSVTLFITDFQFLGLIFLPLITMFLADLEMRSAGFNKRETLLYLALVASLGIILGEAVDLKLIPNIR
jgi:hypothetical protein